MISRPILLLGAVCLLASPFVCTGAPTIQLVVPGYDFPGTDVSYTLGGGISNNGDIAGVFAATGINSGGYERRANGRFSPPILAPNASITVAAGVNNAGVVAGTFNSDVDHGFFYKQGRVTRYDVPGAVHTNVTGLNDAGDFCGYHFTDGTVITPFLNVGGTLIPFSIPGVDVVYPSAINNLGQVVGSYVDPLDPQVGHGFLRNADGSLIYPLDYPDSQSSNISGLNDNGAMVGGYRDRSLVFHAFLLQFPNRFLSYDYPGGDYTTFRGINNSGFISGDALTDTFRAFIARIR